MPVPAPSVSDGARTPADDGPAADRTCGRGARRAPVHGGERLLELEHPEAEHLALKSLPVARFGFAPFGLRLRRAGDVAQVRDPAPDRGNVVEVGEHLFYQRYDPSASRKHHSTVALPARATLSRMPSR